MIGSVAEVKENLVDPATVLRKAGTPLPSGTRLTCRCSRSKKPSALAMKGTRNTTLGGDTATVAPISPHGVASVTLDQSSAAWALAMPASRPEATMPAAKASGLPLNHPGVDLFMRFPPFVCAGSDPFRPVSSDLNARSGRAPTLSVPYPC